MCRPAFVATCEEACRRDARTRPILILPHHKSPAFAAWQAADQWNLRTYFEHGAEKIFSQVSSDSPFHLARTLLTHSIDDIVACTYGKGSGKSRA